MENKNNTKLELYPFNEIVIDSMAKHIPNLILDKKYLISKENKKTFIYDRIKTFNHEKIVRNYNLFFEGIIATLN